MAATTSSILVPSILTSKSSTIVSFTDWVNSNPEVKQLISSGSTTPADLAKIAALQSAYSLGTQNVILQSLKLNQMAVIRVKINAGTATPEELAIYFSLYSEMQQLATDVNAEKDKLAAETALKQQEKDTLLARLKKAEKMAGTISAASAEDLYEYIVRTQSLNPYSRERQCDINFLDMLKTVANDIGESLDNAKAVAELVKQLAKISI